MAGRLRVSDLPTANLENVRTRDLFKVYRAILRELNRREVVRTLNAPAGDYAEYLVAALVKGALATNSEKSWDVRDASGERLQVKARVARGGRTGSRQLSPFRTWDFDRAVVVLFDDEYAIDRCIAFPVDVIRSAVTYREHVNGYVVIASEALLAHDGAEDWTDALRDVAEGT